MSAPATPDLPQAWQYAFDFEDNHCSRGADYVVDDLAENVLTEPLRTEIRALSDEDAHTRLTDLAAEAEAEEDDDRADALREAAASLDYCRDYCNCAADAWDSESDFVGELLTELGDHTWSVVEEDGWRQTRITYPDQDEVSVNSLFSLITRRDGWSDLEAAWNGSTLTMTFSGSSIGRTTLVCTPLTSELHLRTYQAWAEHDPYNEEIAAGIITADPDRLAAADRLWTAIEDPHEVFTDFGALLEALATVPSDGIDAAALEVARTLADSWEASLADLLSVSVSVLDPGTPARAAA